MNDKAEIENEGIVDLLSKYVPKLKINTKDKIRFTYKDKELDGSIAKYMDLCLELLLNMNDMLIKP